MSTTHNLTWVLIADSNTYRLYNYDKNPPKLTLLKEIEHPENRLKDSDLTSDRPGHYKGSGASHGAFLQQSDPKEIKAEEFSREINKELETGRKSHAYEKLILIVQPHMNGLLMQHINKHVRDLITHNIKKETLHLTENELLSFLHEHTNY